MEIAVTFSTKSFSICQEKDSMTGTTKATLSIILIGYLAGSELPAAAQEQAAAGALAPAQTSTSPLSREASGLARTLAPAPPQQQRHWAGRHPVLLGALIGASIGAAAAAIKCDAEAGRGERDQCRAGYWTMGPFLGGVAGFIISLRR